MRVTISFYSYFKDLTGCKQASEELPSGSTLQDLVPGNLHNPWTVVAFALVAATVLKGLFDYAGTFLVNRAGLGILTDLRNDLYNSVLRRSVAFFQRHSTGTLISSIISDVEKVQYAVSSVLAEFLPATAVR